MPAWIMTFFPFALRVLHEMPQIIADIEGIFNDLHAAQPAPDHVVSAFRAAVDAVKQQANPPAAGQPAVTDPTAAA